MSAQEPPRRPERPAEPPTEPLSRPAAPRPGMPVEPAREYERLPPEAPPPDPWWANPWLAVLVPIVSLLIGGIVGYVIGESGKSEGGGGAAHATTNTTTVTQPAKTVTNTV